MAKVDLRVPFSERDAVKRLGARWDSRRKLWFVSDGIDLAPFAKWLPPSFEPNLRSARFFIARNLRSCWKCHAVTRVFAFLLPAGFEARQMENTGRKDVWIRRDEAAFLAYLSAIPEPVFQHIAPRAPHYRLDYSRTIGSFYWMNHCEKCGAALGDFDTMEEHNSPFAPVTPSDARNIVLHAVGHSFEATGYALEWTISGPDGITRTVQDFIRFMRSE
jgi:hypothetical protein